MITHVQLGEFFVKYKFNTIITLQKLEEQFMLQLEEQEALFGPPQVLPPDLTDLVPRHHRGSTRSSLSSVSAD
ncbi:hypothetical protein J6590_013499 [Homalodisca vitripennis]|nr:hypothetical protein J6590_013499 [Homalodisca vitripennis]